MRILAFATVPVLMICSISGSAEADEQHPTKRAEAPALAFSLLDSGGAPHNLGQNDSRRVRAFVFLSTECPISNGYLKTLNELHAKFAAKSVDLFGVVADSTVTRSRTSKHFAEFKTTFPILFDASGLLLPALKPTHVPEAFVLNQDGQVVYRGAIDNAWEAIGRRRPKAEKEFLADAITAALGGKAVAVPETKPVGCLIEAAPRGDEKAKVTYARDIAPIVQARCLNCHREGQVAPFALADYEQTAKRAKQIVRVTQDRIMPPWIPSPGHEKFVAERWLTDRELELFKTWAETGRAKGDDADLPPAPKFADGWRLGKPDLIVKMSEPFTVPADGPDLLQNFVIPIGIAEDKLVAAMEFHPGNKRVAHHAVLFLDDSGTARKLDKATPEPGYANFGGPGFLPSGALGGWSVGNTARPLPNGMGRYLKKGSDLVVQMHYHPTGKPETDQSEIGLYFVKKPVAESLKEPAKLVGSIWMANYEMDIAAGEKNYKRSTSYTLPKEVIMVGVVPHMHLLGKSMTVTAILPDKTVKTLIDIKNWNYNWQDEYYYERPFKLPAGTRLDVEAVFDNSDSNPSNPSSPPKRVTWGDGTTDEMLFCFFLLSAEKTEDLIHVIFDNLRHDTKQPRKVVAK
jgi:peroxiredoxin